jgi:ribonuclease J
MDEIKITPLGGLGRTGALNCLLYETETTAILVDCGAGFVDERFPGVGLIIPNFDILETKRDKLKAVIFTHGHEDHVGATPYLLKKFDLPLYATPFAQGILRAKLNDFSLHNTDIYELKPHETITLGDITIEPVFITHSILDVVAFLIETKGFKAFHCTDFKLDDHAVDDYMMDLNKFEKIGQKGLDLLLLDSTNALEEGRSLSEAEISSSLLDVFNNTRGRLITCLFSSNSYRLQTLLDCAKKTNRKVALTGRSAKEYFRIASNLQRLNLDNIDLYDVEEITQFPENEIFVIVTGSQAEPRSVLNRMANDQFKPFKVRDGDTLIMSSRMIPGNEGRILEMLNKLSMLGASIITDTEYSPIHVSGHAMAEELKDVLKVLKPKHLIPIHGEHRQLKELATIACKGGIPQRNIHLLVDGDHISLNKEGIRYLDQFHLEPVFISENPEYYINIDAIKRRRKLAFNGLVIVSVLYDAEQKAVTLPISLFSEGLFGGSQEAKILKKLTKHIEHLLEEDSQMNKDDVTKWFKKTINRYYKSEYQVRPEIVVMVNEL